MTWSGWGLWDGGSELSNVLPLFALYVYTKFLYEYVAFGTELERLKTASICGEGLQPPNMAYTIHLVKRACEGNSGSYSSIKLYLLLFDSLHPGGIKASRRRFLALLM